MHKLLHILKALEAYYQGQHWTAKGPSFYPDHLFFGRLYEAAGANIDAVVEIALANRSTDDSLFDTKTVLAEVLKLLMKHVKKDCCATFASSLETALLLEGELESLLNSLVIEYQNDLGINNLLTTVAEAHKNRVYLINRHFKA